MIFDFSFLLDYWRFLLGGVWITLSISAAAIGVGFVVGLIVGIARTYGGRPVDFILSLYVDTMRSIPLLVILVWIFFAMPLVTGHSMTPITAGILGLGLHLGAFVAELVRAGLTSVRPGQMRAALALGMSPAQAVRIVILPQALVRMLPNFGSLLVITIKDSAIASVIAVPELLRQSQVVVGQTYKPFETFTVVILIYFVISWPVARGVDYIYRRIAHLGAS
ncbi:amino acid ABC transporter permease [Devosia faecipullorum]|uniref:amino acid ABC transporter permease n=1 Tax=Devosia faecipullorum TaxID=2755039 RepID=UPI00187B27B7|nr:amino acid ABC transporter permease [Devosia faecipullorum]MBE7733336.1 amino acid ABC transporter permease [Devosia faecipullorum]